MFVLDIVFSEPSFRPKKEVLTSLRNKYNLSSSVFKEIKKHIQDRDPDLILSKTFLKHRDKIVLGSFYDRTLPREEFLLSSDLHSMDSKKWGGIKTLKRKDMNHPSLFILDKVEGHGFVSPFFLTTDWVKNTPLLSGGYEGFFNAHLDPDGSIRKSCLIVETKDSYELSIAFQAFLLSQNYRAEILLDKNKKDSHETNLVNIRIVDNKDGSFLFNLPLDSNACLFIHYSGSQKTFPYLSASDLLTEDEEFEVERAVDRNTVFVQTFKKKEFLKDKIVLFGATANAIFDMRVTPVDENFPGVEVHANILNTLMKKNFLSSSLEIKKGLLMALVVVGVTLSFLFYSLSALWGVLLFLCMVIFFLGLDIFLFSFKGILLSSSFPLILLFSEYGGMALLKYLSEEKEKRRIKKTFSKYVSPSVFQEILSSSSSSDIFLKGRKEDVTVSFLDIRNFTHISEKMDPLFLNKWLSEYLTFMTDIILKHSGTLDKYLGDAILSFFGAPVRDVSHAHKACLCALEQMDRMKDLKEKFKRKSWPIFDVGISLNTGECYVGDLGSQKLSNYTVLGETVNIASRLESLNIKYKTHILIGENTYRAVKGDFLCRKLDEVHVKGKESALSVYELLGKS